MPKTFLSREHLPLDPLERLPGFVMPVIELVMPEAELDRFVGVGVPLEFLFDRFDFFSG
jgi:hypothetical protein